MINVTRLLGADNIGSDALRYGRGHGAPKSASERRPVVVWNITRRCNLRCVHCYSDSDNQRYPGELTWDEMVRVVDDLADFGVPVLLLSGGEPTIHPRFLDLSRYARAKGLRLTLSTNGTLIDEEMAAQLKELGYGYVGISLDGIGETHDRFRGRFGTFDKVMRAIRACRSIEQKVGLRLTLTSHTIEQIDPLLDLVEKEGIDRVCFYHLVYSGRGSAEISVPAAATRGALDRIMARAEAWNEAGHGKELLTVAQPADGAYLLHRLREDGRDELADSAEELLTWNGGGRNGSATGIGNIDPLGNVHPDQFWQNLVIGNVRQRPFSKIWQEPDSPMLAELRQERPKFRGRCADCRFLGICGGGFRVRAWQKTGDLWADDPGCYFTDAECARPKERPAELAVPLAS